MTSPTPLPNIPVTPEILPAAGPLDPALALLAPDPLARAFALPCLLTLEIPVVHFTVGGLLQLEVGSIVETAMQQNEDLPLTANSQLIGMVEIEVVGDNLAVRLAGIA